MSPDSPKRKLAAIMFTNIACGLGSLPDDRIHKTTPADGGTNPAESGAPLDPLLPAWHPRQTDVGLESDRKKEGTKKSPLERGVTK